MTTKDRVLGQFAEWLEIRCRDYKTVRSYRATASYFYDHCRSLPAHWSPEQKVESFVARRVKVDDISPSTLKTNLAALNNLFLSRGHHLGNLKSLRPRQRHTERHCPSTGELRALLATLGDTPQVPARFLTAFIAGVGLRVDECLSIRLKDLRPHQSHLRLVLRDPKHGNDRVVPIPDIFIAPLRQQYTYARAVFRLDRQATPPLPLQIPQALARKYPRSPHTLAWMFLFPSTRPERHPRTKQPMRWHLPANNLRDRMAKACDHLESTGAILGRITPHCLRHWFADNFTGDIRDLQAILGHKSLETTQTYRHPHLDRITSPITALLTPPPGTNNERHTKQKPTLSLAV